MSRLPTLALPLLSLAWAAPAVAGDASPQISLDDNWKVLFDGQYRPRYLWNSGKDFVDGGVDANQNVTQRARLGLTLKHKKGPSFTLRMQDVRAWGSELDTLGDFAADGMDAHEAFMKVPLGKGMSFKIGRQEMAFDNHRLVGTVGWSPQGRSFDGVRFDRVGEGYDFTAFATTLSPDLKQIFGGVHASFDLAKGHKASVIILSRTLDPDTRHTIGGQANGHANGFKYTAEAYYQLGEEANESVSAWMGAASAGYTVQNDLKPGALVRAEVLSGDGTAQGTFDTLYATNHKFYGEMDYFLAIGPHTATLGLMDLGGQLSMRPLEPTKVQVDVHHFSAMEPDAADETAFGDEVDLKVVHNAGKGLTLRALYGLYLPGEAMRTPHGIASDTDLQAEHLFYFTTDFKI